MKNMNNVEMAEVLSSLAQLDINAAHAYGQAIENMDIITLREEFRKFRDDHSENANALTKVIRALDVVPPEHAQDFKGFLMEGWAALRGSTGIEGTLKSMKTNGEYVSKKYREATALPLTEHIKALVERNYKIAETHLEFIEKALANRIWEQ
jgi:hypothetical protein